MRRKVQTLTDLPGVGSAFETDTLEFKKTSGDATHFELAKDVAALANNRGGSIVVGAVEFGGVLRILLPLDRKGAAEQHRRYEQAIVHRCSPRPTVSFERIGHDDGFLLAVNVEPEVIGLVGVRLAAHVDEGYGGDAWTFPVRRGSDTVWLEPEKVPMYTSTQVRRMAILLGSIPEEALVRVVEITRDGYRNWEGVVAEVSEAENFVRFTWTDHNRGTDTRLALDRVETVWRESNDVWRVYVSVAR